MTKEDFSRAYRAAMGWEAAVVHDAELPIEYPVCRYVFQDGIAVTAVCPDIPIDAVPQGASLSDALDALFDGLAVARELRWLEWLVEVDVEVDAFATEDVAEEDFGVKARRLDAFFLEILFGPFEDAADGPEFLHVSPPASAAAPDSR